MIEGVLYFALGFLTAALLALMAAPAIWRRAVILTRRRIESSLPLNLNEIQADKDQLRAAVNESDGYRIEIVAQDTQLQNLADKVGALNKEGIETKKNSGQMKSEIKALKQELASEKRRSRDIDRQLTGNQATLVDREERLDRRENAVLRERMNDLAAQVTAMTSLLEGDKSLISEILAKDSNNGKRKTGKTAVPAGEGNITSLAKRIRALQLAATQ